MYDFQPVTDRVAALRDKYRNSGIPFLSAERMRLTTEFYRDNEAQTGILKRARHLAYVVEHMTVKVWDDELIVGNMAPTFRGSQIFPEHGGNWIFNELKEGTFRKRGIDSEGFDITEEDEAYILSVEDFWKGRSVSDHLEKIAPDGLAKIVGTFIVDYQGKEMATGPTGHFVGNFHKALDRGFADIKREAQEKLDELEGRCFGDGAKRYTFYKAITIVCDAAMRLPKRYAEECRRIAASGVNEKGEPLTKERIEELGRMAASLDYILDTPCKSFYDAVQSVFMYQLLLIMDGNMHGLTFGRIDQYIGKYYDADAKAGLITRLEGQEMVDCLFLKISGCSKAWAEKRALRSGGYTSGQHATLGGVDRDGNDATNEASYMMLEASARLLLHDPPLSLRMHKGTPEKLWECAFETTKKVGGIPTLQNDDVIIPTLVEDGLSLEDARNYCIIGCVEPTGCGDHWAAPGGSGKETYWNMANALLVAINNGINPLTGKQGPIQCGYLYDMKSFDEVKEAYEKTVNYYADWQVTMTNFYELLAAEMTPLPIVSATMDGCMEKGMDVTWGGEKYNSTGTSGIGCANVADGLSVIKYLVFDTKKYTAKELYDAIMADWEGYEPMRQEVLNSVPRYGNGDPYVDDLARWSMDVFAKRVRGGSGFRGKYRPGIYPVSAHIAFGGNTFATPDGRKSRTPLADGVSPMQGLDKNGPVSVLNSVACLNHANFDNGTLLNMKFHPKAVEGIDGSLKLRTLVDTFFDKGGMHLQYNVVGSDTLRAAQKDPDKYKDLVIRIAGFSAYFVELYKDLQDDLISRTDIMM
jgi:formate C-acetyltransferase